MNINNNKGFSLIELMVVIAIMTILATTTLPDFLGLTQRSRLRKTARDAYSSMQKARMGAIENGFRWQVSFDQTNGNLKITEPGPDGIIGTSDDVTHTSIDLKDSGYIGVQYGMGPGIGAIPGGTNPSNGFSTFSGNKLDFMSDGSANKAGTLYFTGDNGKADTYAVSVLFTTGRIKLWKNTGSGWEG